MDLNYQVFTSISKNWWSASLVPVACGWFIGNSYKPRKDYENKKQPKFHPPASAFGPAWTLLYLTMGYASHLAYKADPLMITNASRNGSILYIAQLAANFAWMPLFYGLAKPKLALADLGILTGLVGWLAKTWWPLAPTASKWLIPYLAWLGYAGYLVSNVTN
ncbi:TspO/peripheral benzodiazepine receptor [Schizosaccharomyces pombe]